MITMLWMFHVCKTKRSSEAKNAFFFVHFWMNEHSQCSTRQEYKISLVMDKQKLCMKSPIPKKKQTNTGRKIQKGT